jgi:hypothetical protein
MKYFAYGSNMCTKRLRQGVPSAAFDTKAVLHCHVLKFHKRSQDGSGKCNLSHTGNHADEVHGVVFDIDEEEKPALDDAEGRHKGYNQITINVHTDNGTIALFTYVADGDAIDDSLQPYTWYKNLVLFGAREYSLPESYVHAIELVPANQDPNAARDRKKRALMPAP